MIFKILPTTSSCLAFDIFPEGVMMEFDAAVNSLFGRM